MATQSYTDGVTLTAAAEFNRFDSAAYSVLSGVAGTDTITATGPANYTYLAALPAVWFIPAATNTGATTINITPSGGAALGAKNIFAGGLALVGGELVSGVPACVIYDGTRFQLLTPVMASAAWTPVLTFATAGDLSVAYTTQVGRYERKGREVTAHFRIITSTFTHTTAAGDCRITGLPFAASSTTNYVGTVGWQRITKANYTHVWPQVAASAQIITLVASGSAQTAAAVEAADMPTAGQVLLVGNVTYEV